MMKKMVVCYLEVTLGLALLLAFGAAGAQSARSEEARPKYIFLFIGDGMGGNQRQLAEAALKRKLAMNHLPVSGTTSTLNAEGNVTDSAAAATAIACGVKTQNGMVGIAPDGRVLESIAVKAKKAGMKVGFISLGSLNNPTPAAFYAHARSRDDLRDIAFQLAESEFDFFGGGRWRVAPHEQEQILQRIEEHGYSLISRPFIIYRRSTCAIDVKEKTRLSLAQLTSAAIRSLDQDKGFFLMVEGADIDGAGHGDDGAMAIRETEKLDLAVQEALNFLAKRPDACLIVVTGDHETGGLTIVDPEKTPGLLRQTGSRGAFRDALDALAKTNAGADAYLAEVKRFYQLDSLTDAEENKLRQSWENYLIKGEKEKSASPAKDALRLFNQRCGILWTSSGNHTTNPVQTTAAGIGAAAFAGHYDNTEICRRMEKLLPSAATANAGKGSTNTTSTTRDSP